MVDAYVNCKHGREQPVYPHPVMEEILTETYGVMVYQEQVMRILNRLGGIELSSAYACIKAISKKKQDIIDQRHAEFVKGAQERGLAKAVIDDIWNMIVVFAGYGFNKSTAPPTPRSATRRPTSRRTSPPSSWPRCCPARSTTATSATSWSSTSTTPAGSAPRCCRPTSTPASPTSPSSAARSSSA